MLFKEKLANICQWLKKKSFVLCCGVAPVILLSALLVTCDFGCNVIVNGEVIGTAPSSEYVQGLIHSINTELSPYLDGIEAIAVKPVTTPKLVVGKCFTPSQELGEKLKSYCPYMEKAYTVKSNGKTVAAFTSREERADSYDKFIEEMSTSAQNYEVLDEVTFEYELVPYGLIKSGESAYRMLMRTYEFSDTVNIAESSDLYSVLTSYCMTEEDFMSLNPDYREGKTKKVKIKSDIPYIRLLAKENYTETTIIKHITRYEESAGMYEGTRDIKQEGKSGFNSIKKTRYVLNGTELGEISVEELHEDAVNEIVLYGTKPTPKGKSSGSIANPFAGVLTSRYGSREGRRHAGIDISGAEGADIKAADGGKVVFAGWDDSGYGNMIKIEHSTGYTTLYAHCSKLYVKEGDKVGQGDVIAAVGNTGRSTGPHLHFEVIDTNTNKSLNPLDFFDF